MKIRFCDIPLHKEFYYKGHQATKHDMYTIFIPRLGSDGFIFVDEKEEIEIFLYEGDSI